MLTIIVPVQELYDETKQEFVTYDEVTLILEHSLISLSKWEAKHEVPFLSSQEKSTEEIVDYVRFMCISRNIPDEVFLRLSEKNIADINQYISAKMTATWFNEEPGAPKSREVITAELIYYWMIVYNIPIELEKWHLNRLFTLIRVCSVKQAKPEKMSRSEMARRRRELNDQRRQQLGTRG